MKLQVVHYKEKLVINLRIFLRGILSPLFFIFLLLIFFSIDNLHSKNINKRYSPTIEFIKINKFQFLKSSLLKIDYFKKIETSHFVIYYGNEYPSTTFWIDYNKNGIPDYIDFVKDTIEYVYNYEINELGYEPSFEDRCIVVIGNTGIKINSNQISIDNDVCGYSYKIGDNFILVLNPIPPSTVFTKSKDMLKITIAHEFFHIIQFGYNINLSNNNLWLYEGTAVWMENKVFPNIDDYLYSYVEDFIKNISMSLISDKGFHMYGTSLFFDYLSVRFGDDIIRHIWEEFSLTSNSLIAIKNVLKNYYNISFEEILYEFYKALLNPENYFSDGKKLLTENFRITPVDFSCEVLKKISIGFLGALFIKGNCEYNGILNLNKDFIIFNKKIYKEKGFNFGNIDNSPKILIPYNDNFLNFDIDTTIEFYGKNKLEWKINKGWNLIGLPENVYDMVFFNKKTIESIWYYKEGNWEIYIPDNNETLKKVIKNYNILEISSLSKKDGIWIKAKYEDFIKFNNLDVEICNVDNIKEGWFLKSTGCICPFPVSFYSSLNINMIWKWSNNSWEVWSPLNSIIEILKKYKIPEIKDINISEGFWVKF